MKKNSWIDINEQLPKEGVDVLVTRQFNPPFYNFKDDDSLEEKVSKGPLYVEIAKLIDGRWVSYADDYKLQPLFHDVLAWMPVPEPWGWNEEI